MSQGGGPRRRSAQDGRATFKLYLIVEDDEMVAVVLRTFLDLAGQAACVASCASDADRFLREWRFDGIIVDVGLPDGDGLDWLEAQVARDPELATDLVVTSGVPLADGNRARVHRLGAVFLEKPFNPEALLELLGLRDRVSARRAGLRVPDVRGVPPPEPQTD
jgi:DNA-binding response OmpR family regulator